MGLFDFFNGIPQWARELPQYLRPSTDQISRLEILRNQTGISHQEFLMHISSHPETTRRLQYYLYDQMKKQNPSESEQDLLKMLVMNRALVAIAAGSDAFNLAKARADGISDQAFDARLQEIVKMYPNLESLTNAIIRDDKRQGGEMPPSPEFEGVARRVTHILRAR